MPYCTVYVHCMFPPLLIFVSRSTSTNKYSSNQFHYVSITKVKFKRFNLAFLYTKGLPDYIPPNHRKLTSVTAADDTPRKITEHEQWAACINSKWDYLSDTQRGFITTGTISFSIDSGLYVWDQVQTIIEFEIQIVL